MAYDDVLTTARCAAAFANEVEAAGGTILDAFDDGQLLIARAILPRVRFVRPKDRLQGGVALRVSLPEISVHPYVLRQVCHNGAIMAKSIRSRHVRVVEGMTPTSVESELREAIRASSLEEAFDESVDHIRTSLELRVDHALMVLPLLRRMPELLPTVKEGAAPDPVDVFRLLFERVRRDHDQSGFEVMNAVTSLARDTRDPEVRCRLEKLGGAIPTLLAYDELPPDDHAVRAEDTAGDLAAWWRVIGATT